MQDAEALLALVENSPVFIDGGADEYGWHIRRTNAMIIRYVRALERKQKRMRKKVESVKRVKEVKNQ